MIKNLKKRTLNTYYTSNEGSVGYYLSEIAKYKQIPDNEIRTLIKKAQKGDKSSMDAIVNSNQRFVFMMAKRFSGGNNDLLSDLISEANIGLLNAIKRFDTKSNNGFLTYAVHWIQKQIFIFLTFTDPIVKVPNKSKTLKVPEIKHKFYLINGRYPTNEEIISELKNEFNYSIIDESDLYQLSVKSVDCPLKSSTNNDETYTIMDLINENDDSAGSTTSNNEYESEVDESYSKMLISKSMCALSEKEKKVIKLLYGIDCYREYEIQEVAEKMGITKEGIRLINKRAIEKLRYNVKKTMENI